MHHPQELDLNINLVYLGGLRKEFRIVRNPANERLYSQGIYKIKSRTYALLSNNTLLIILSSSFVLLLIIIGLGLIGFGVSKTSLFNKPI